MLVLHRQDKLITLVLLCQLMEEMAHALQSHIVLVEIEAQRQVGVESLQT